MFGRLRATDERDYKLSDFMRAPSELVAFSPSYKYWTQGAVLDQGQTPMCVGYSWYDFLSCSPTRNKKHLATTSPQQIYHNAQMIDEWPGENYDGTSVRAGCKALQELGLLQTYAFASSLDEVKQFLLLYGPVVFGTNWYNSMFVPNPWNVINVETASGVAGGHAYLITGYNSKTKLFKLQNSWGTGWARKGSVYINEADLNMLFIDQGEACTAVELL